MIFTLIHVVIVSGLGDQLHVVHVFKRDVEVRRTMMTVVNLGFRVSQPRFFPITLIRTLSS